MELDDLKREWQQRDAELNATLRVNARAVAALARSRGALARLTAWLSAETAIAALLVLALGGFAFDHVSETTYLAFAIAVGAYVLSLGIAAVAQIVALSRLDWSAPVAAIQRRLESLRITRARTIQVSIGAGAILWAPALLLAVRAATGVDAAAVVSTTWLAANVALGLLVFIAAVVIARRSTDRLAGDSLAARLGRILAGTSIAAATRFLESFEGEEVRS